MAGELGPTAATTLVLQLETSGVPPAPVLALLHELEAVSAKIARAAVEALPELHRRAGCSQLMSWLDVGVALAESSGATALKYFKDSPLILGVIEGQRPAAFRISGRPRAGGVRCQCQLGISQSLHFAS